MGWQMNMKDPTKLVEAGEDIAQCIFLILATVKGSDPMRPDFGSDLPLFIDKPLTENKPKLIYSISEAITKWEKRVKLERSEVAINEKGTLHITLYLQILASGEQTTITLNF